ncbi:MAG: hypothetical protein QW459_04180 [Sulfolobales archaeon]
MNRGSVALVSAVALALAALLATGAVLVYAKNANERGFFGGPPVDVFSGIKPQVNANLTSKLANLFRLRLLQERIKLAKALGPRVEVSEEYREKVLKIATEDTDVSKLLEDGYNITGIKPVIKAYVEADGSVSLRADESLVILRKENSIAVVLVNLKEERVTKIAVYSFSVSVIEK